MVSTNHNSIMKRLLSLILIGSSVIISSCNGKRIHISETNLELDNTGFPVNEKFFLNGDPFTGIIFDENDENQVLFEINFKERSEEHTSELQSQD